jgi:hypothetical protein
MFLFSVNISDLLPIENMPFLLLLTAMSVFPLSVGFESSASLIRMICLPPSSLIICDTHLALLLPLFLLLSFPLFLPITSSLSPSPQLSLIYPSHPPIPSPNPILLSQAKKVRNIKRTNRIILHHTQRPTRPRSLHRPIKPRHSHTDNADCDRAGFRCCEG